MRGGLPLTGLICWRKRWIAGVVTCVGDADSFRLYHTPGFGWRGPFKFRGVPTTKRAA
ncbi:hypothetical protein BC826DRAFT_169060 [Russula brevipes]|nr:hypothetical protein BC826DRAFT_169060 [Russula brevipes]